MTHSQVQSATQSALNPSQQTHHMARSQCQQVHTQSTHPLQKSRSRVKQASKHTENSHLMNIYSAERKGRFTNHGVMHVCCVCPCKPPTNRADKKRQAVQPFSCSVKWSSQVEVPTLDLLGPCQTVSQPLSNCSPAASQLCPAVAQLQPQDSRPATVWLLLSYCTAAAQLPHQESCLARVTAAGAWAPVGYRVSGWGGGAVPAAEAACTQGHTRWGEKIAASTGQMSGMWAHVTTYTHSHSSLISQAS